MQNAHSVSVEEILPQLGVQKHVGLSSSEVRLRQTKYGKNEIPPPPGTSFLKLILSQFEDLLVLILLGAAVISFVLACLEEGEDRLTAFVEPAVILIILICNATVGVVQETNAEKAIERLKESEARDATVIRDGAQQIVHASELVPGDIIVLTVGDRVPADCRVLELQSSVLSVDQAPLTGESEAVNKISETINNRDAIIQDKKNMLFSGTLIVRGKTLAVVAVTGANTEIGAIAHTLGKDDDDEKTPLQQKLDEFGEQLSKVIGVICIVVWLINIGHFTDPVHGSAVRGAIYYFKIAVALAVAAIPEGLPAVVTTCLALGTMKMAKKNAIVRSLPSVETLGCTTVICSDKTGTLTTNMMSVQKMMIIESERNGSLITKEFLIEGDSFSPYGQIVSSADVGGRANLFTAGLPTKNASNELGLDEISRICALCNEAALSYKDETGVFGKTGAPTEAALLVLAEKIGCPDAAQQQAITTSQQHSYRIHATRQYWSTLYERLCVLEFDRDRKSMSVLVQAKTGKQAGEKQLLVKGAPESILERCTHVRDARGHISPLTTRGKTEIRDAMETYAQQGLRCIGLAYINKPPHAMDTYKNPDKFKEIESHMIFVGLVSMLDPPRPGVAESVAKCKSAGIRVIVITGDNKITAESICRRIGVFGPNENLAGKSYTGSEFEAMSVQQKNDAVKSASLFSRVEPRHKLELVTLLKEQKEVVAMTGDGVNDATALNKADIGIAMGSGTDVAREASDMVLQDDNFATIVMAVEEGRAIYANTKQFIRYLISSNIGEVACIFLTAAVGMPEALIPVQLLWVNLVTDGLPATALGFNPPDTDVMLRPPRGRTESIINRWTFFRYVVIGIYVGIGTVGGFIWWHLYGSRGSQITWNQLTHFHQCAASQEPGSLFHSVDCSIFDNPLASTMSLSILVTIEMFNALNALSENQSLLSVSPLSNLYVVAACTLSFLLHLGILYIPFFAGVFHVSPLNTEEWLWVLYLSFPVFIIDEVLKWYSRRLSGSERTTAAKKEE